MKNGSLILRGLIATFIVIFIGAFIAPSHFGLLGQFAQERMNAIANAHCFEAGGHLIPECEEYRK